jgi:mono/diheme cytochrome c family protein
MKRIAHILPLVFASVLPFLLAAPSAAVAQDSARSDQEKLGARLFNQSCVECHLKQQLGTTTYAPALSQDTLGGKADVIHDVISNGTPRMPGFKIQFAPAQIDAIVAYIKTIPAASAAPRTGKAGGAGEPD